MTGIELIAQERQEQIEKHKWNDTEETWYLPSLATYVIMHDDDAEKDNVREYLEEEGIDSKWFDKFIAKNELERLITSGALIAAEIDRIQKLKE